MLSKKTIDICSESYPIHINTLFEMNGKVLDG